MRRINSLEDAQKAINELLDWQSLHSSKDWDFRGLKISNASDGVKPQDYATVRQLPVIPTADDTNKDLDYGIIFVKDGAVGTGDIIPADVIGKGREGIPHQVHLFSRVPPSSGPLIINMVAEYKIGTTVTSVTLLSENLSLPQDSTDVVSSSLFVTPTPTLGYLHRVYPTIIADGGAEEPTILLIVRRFR